MRWLRSAGVFDPAEFLFIYDNDGNLVKKIKPDGSRTLYVGGIYEVDKNSSGTETGTKTYYPAGGALRITVVAPASNTLYYVLKDHLSSASVLTNNTGAIVTNADVRYYPFGEARFSTAPMLTDKLFTRQREITELGVYRGCKPTILHDFAKTISGIIAEKISEVTCQTLPCCLSATNIK